MTHRTNARIAGWALLLYIAAGISALVLSARVLGGADLPARLANVAAHPAAVGVTVLLSLVTTACALALAVTLHAITREVDADVALAGLVCRTAEAVVGQAVPYTLLIAWLAAAPGPSAPDAAAARNLAALLLKAEGLTVVVSATFFAWGSAAFCHLLLRGRLMPAGLAWLGVAASWLLVGALPLRLAGFLPPGAEAPLWIPMALFEIPAGVWLIARGVPAASVRRA